MIYYWVVGLGIDIVDILFCSDIEFVVFDNEMFESSCGVIGIGVFDEGFCVCLIIDVCYIYVFVSDVIDLNDNW